jgi:phenylalanyl-tRNA synthetase beta chain
MGLAMLHGKRTLVEMGTVRSSLLKRFDCRQEVFFVDFDWDTLQEMAAEKAVVFRELPRQLPVYRDLAMVVDKQLTYDAVEKTIRNTRLDKLREVKLFDIFVSEKLGQGKKSLAVSFTFLDEDKTLTDKEIETMVSRIVSALEKEVQAEIRKS